MSTSVSIYADISDTVTKLSRLQGVLGNEIESAIDNSVRKIHDTINTDYRRSGSAHPSYLNPSRSGLGFTDRSGRLRGSISTKVERKTRQIIGTVFAGMPYDVFVELLWGGQYSFMLPAFEQNKNEIVHEIEQAFIRAVYRL